MPDDPFDVPDSEATARPHRRWIAGPEEFTPDLRDRVPRAIKSDGRLAFDCMCVLGVDHDHEGNRL